jgi:hypothetical protein
MNRNRLLLSAALIVAAVCLGRQLIGSHAPTLNAEDQVRVFPGVTTWLSQIRDRSSVDQTVEDYVRVLPEDGGEFHTSVFTHSDWQRRQSDIELLAAFKGRNPKLTKLASETQFHHYTPASRVYSRYQNHVTALPAVWVQDAEGRMIYKASGPNVPQDSFRLFDDIREAFQERFPNRCPGPNCPTPPQPPLATPVIEQPLNPIPDSVKPDAESSDDGYAVAGVVGVLLLVAGVGLAWRRQHG